MALKPFKMRPFLGQSNGGLSALKGVFPLAVVSLRQCSECSRSDSDGEGAAGMADAPRKLRAQIKLPAKFTPLSPVHRSKVRERSDQTVGAKFTPLWPVHRSKVRGRIKLTAQSSRPSRRCTGQRWERGQIKLLAQSSRPSRRCTGQRWERGRIKLPAQSSHPSHRCTGQRWERGQIKLLVQSSRPSRRCTGQRWERGRIKLPAKFTPLLPVHRSKVRERSDQTAGGVHAPLAGAQVKGEREVRSNCRRSSRPSHRCTGQRCFNTFLMVYCGCVNEIVFTRET